MAAFRVLGLLKVLLLLTARLYLRKRYSSGKPVSVGSPSVGPYHGGGDGDGIEGGGMRRHGRG